MIVNRTAAIAAWLSVLLGFGLVSSPRTVAAESKLTPTEQKFLTFASDYLERYQKWQRQYLDDFDTFQQQAMLHWGEGLVSDNSQRVEYSDDFSERVIINLEQGTLEVSTLTDKEEDTEEVLARIGKRLNALVDDPVMTMSGVTARRDFSLKSRQLEVMPIRYDQSGLKHDKALILEQSVQGRNVIDKQMDFIHDDTSMPQAQLNVLDNLAKEQLLLSTRQRLKQLEENYAEAARLFNSNDEKLRATIVIKLPDDAMAQRAGHYQTLVEKYAEENGLSAPLVMAIIHTESSFDPKAKSPVPAYGLMQVVPTSAGWDVNRYLHNIDSPMPASQLYQPGINIETGTTYLKLLDTRYLKSVENAESRMYCMIAAYNTGAGNVARAFNTDGSRNFNRAARQINAMSPEQVRQQLVSDLPYEETQRYLALVLKREELY